MTTHAQLEGGNMPIEEGPEAEIQEAKRYEGVTDLIEAAPAAIKESKSGFKTTEFWIAVAVSVLTVLDGIPLPERYEGIVVAGLGAVYALSRGIAKKGIPSVEVEEANTVNVER